MDLALLFQIVWVCVWVCAHTVKECVFLCFCVIVHSGRGFACKIVFNFVPFVI